MNQARGADLAMTARPAGPERDWLPLVFVGLLLVAAMLAVYGGPTLSGHFPDTDDTMRMVEVRGFLGGQGWFDMSEPRLAPPGIVMHWSRLVDLPIATLAVALSWVTDPVAAERLAAIAWPLVLLVAALALFARLAAVLVGREGVLLALGMVATSYCIWNYFPPGRVDHHNVQLVLGLGFVAALSRIADGPRFAAAAGFLAALMTAVGLESLPWVAGGTLWLAALWVADGEERAATLRAYGVSLAIGTAVFLLVQRGPSFFAVRCDTLSIVHLVATGLGAFAIWAVAVKTWHGRGRRLAALAVAGAVVLGIVFLLFPGCAGGPYAGLPREFVDRWLSHVGESRSFLQVAATSVGMLAQYSVAALGLAAAIFLAARDRPRALAWSLVATLAGVLFAVGLLQVRFVVPATVLAALPIAAVAMRARAGAPGAVLQALVFLAGLFAGSTFAQAITIETAARLATGRPAAPAVAAGACWTNAAVTAAADLPPGLVLAPIDLGPSILYFTPHSVLGAPYHRDVAGNLAVLDAFAAAPEEARRRAAETGARYLFFCPGEPVYEVPADGSLAAMLERGDAPDWLAPIPADSEARVRLYRIAGG